MEIEKLLEVMRRLRDPESGCPWDLAQNYASIIPYTIEEAYEVAEAVDQNDMDELRIELGDLLFQVVFLSQLASEENLFDFNDVVAAIVNKLIRRHPHVFADAQYESEQEFKQAWEQSKRDEQLEKGKPHRSLIDGVSKALPALRRAQKVQAKASKVGFDWADIEPVFAKISEEVTEVREAIEHGDESHVAEELGDLLFAVVNLGRFLKQDSEDVLRRATAKFEQRFHNIEALLEERGEQLEGKTESELIALWDHVKKMDKA